MGDPESWDRRGGMQTSWGDCCLLQGMVANCLSCRHSDLSTTLLKTSGVRNVGEFRFLCILGRQYGTYSPSPKHSQWSLAQHPVNKTINIPVVKCINIHTKWDNKDYKQPYVSSGQVLRPNKFVVFFLTWFSEFCGFKSGRIGIVTLYKFCTI